MRFRDDAGRRGAVTGKRPPLRNGRPSSIVTGRAAARRRRTCPPRRRNPTSAARRRRRRRRAGENPRLAARGDARWKPRVAPRAWGGPPAAPSPASLRSFTREQRWRGSRNRRTGSGAIEKRGRAPKAAAPWGNLPDNGHGYLPNLFLPRLAIPIRPEPTSSNVPGSGTGADFVSGTRMLAPSREPKPLLKANESLPPFA